MTRGAVIAVVVGVLTTPLATSEAHAQSPAEFVVQGIQAYNNLELDVAADLLRQAPENRFDPACVDDPLGREKGIAERQVTLGDLFEVRVETKKCRTEQAVSEAVSAGGENVSDPSVEIGVIALVIPNGIFTEQQRQELVVGDCLHFSPDHAACLFVDLVAGQCGIGSGVNTREPVMLAHEERMHGGEGDLLVGPNVAGQEQGWVRASGIGQAIQIEGQQIAIAGQQASLPKERAEGVGARRVGAVYVRGIDPRGDLVHLLARVLSTRP